MLAEAFFLLARRSSLRSSGVERANAPAFFGLLVTPAFVNTQPRRSYS